MSTGHPVDCVPLHQAAESCDPVAKLCAFLMAKRGWSHHRLAQALGVPPLVLEECIRNGVSSGALHGRLARWIAEGGGASLPQSLVQAVVQAPAGILSGSDTPESQLDGDPLADLDPVTRAYFVELGSSIGQSFISILNDPRQARDNFRWGSWFVGIVSNALDHKTYMKRAGTVTNEQPSSDTLMARYNQNWDYMPYLQLVSGTLSENNKGVEPLANVPAATPQLGSVLSCALNENLPWPQGVPEEFFDTSYDAANELRLLERVIEERGGSKIDEDGVPITATTFSDDFEEIEKRMKKLREWEGAVESCLLRHVQSRADQFFIVSQDFTDRAGEARRALDDLQQTRADVDAYGTGFVREMMTIAQNYRIRHGLTASRDLAVGMMETLSALSANENWISLPERDMTELPAVVENYCALYKALWCGAAAGAGEANNNNNNNFSETGNFTRVRVLRDVPERMLLAKESLHKMIMREIELTFNPLPGSDVEEGRLLRAVRAAGEMNLLPTIIHQNRERLPDIMWTNARSVFVTGMMDSGAVGEKGANSLLEVAVAGDSSREEKLSLIGLSDSCRFPAFMRIFSAIAVQISQAVRQASRCWALLVVGASVRSSFRDVGAHDGEESLWDMSRRNLVALFAAAEGTVALFLEARSRPSCVPTNVHDLETLVKSGYDFMQGMVAVFHDVAAMVGDLGDPWSCLSGKQLKAAVVRLGKEHVRSRHAANIERIRLTLEGEKWVPCDSDADFQSRVSVIFNGGDEAVSALRALIVFTDFKDSRETHPSSPKTCQETAVAPSKEPDAVPDLNSTAVGEAKVNKPFILPSLGGQFDGRVVSVSLQILLEMLHDYDGYLGRFPFLAFDIMGKVYDLLRLYNSQCAALLLGAMAVETGTLESITVPHMAVASQNLALLYDGIPFMQRRWERVVDGDNLPSSISEDLERVRQGCQMCRLELLGKIAALVKEKVGVLADTARREWQDVGSLWVMTTLRETARVMHLLNPLVPVSDCRGVVVPMLGTFARMMRTVMMSPDVDEVELGVMRSDVLVFKANVERFGFDVMRCVELCASPTDAMKESKEPCATDEVVLAWFFGQA